MAAPMEKDNSSVDTKPPQNKPGKRDFEDLAKAMRENIKKRKEKMRALREPLQEKNPDTSSIS